MAKKMKIWYDKESDLLEVLFSDEPGYMKETSNEHILERVNADGNIIGYIIFSISKIDKNSPIYAEFEFA